MKTVLYSDDINLLTYWDNALDNETISVDNLEDLYQLNASTIIINYSACLGKCNTILAKLNSNKNRVLVLHRTPNIETAKELLKLGASGYGNALMREHFILSALSTIEDGMIWLYPAFTTQLIMNIAESEKNTNDDKLEILTSREKEVALFLKDGLTYKEIGLKLGITPRTIKAHAQNTYEKLNVKDRLGLALLLK